MPKSTIRQFLSKHPKMTGVLFTALLLLSQTGIPLGGDPGYPGP